MTTLDHRISRKTRRHIKAHNGNGAREAFGVRYSNCPLPVDHSRPAEVASDMPAWEADAIQRAQAKRARRGAY